MKPKDIVLEITELPMLDSLKSQVRIEKQTFTGKFNSSDNKYGIGIMDENGWGSCGSFFLRGHREKHHLDTLIGKNFKDVADRITGFLNDPEYNVLGLNDKKPYSNIDPKAPEIEAIFGHRCELIGNGFYFIIPFTGGGQISLNPNGEISTNGVRCNGYHLFKELDRLSYAPDQHCKRSEVIHKTNKGENGRIIHTWEVINN